MIACWGLASLGCAPPGVDPGPELDLQGLAFVRAGQAEPFVGLRCASHEDLLVDRFEVTRELWQAWREREPARVAALKPLGSLHPGSHLPVVGMTLDEAMGFAAARGMRLPTVDEWIFIAAGSRSQTWPHGNTRQVSVANTVEVGLGRSAPVGSFPGGASTGTGILDLAGNVWEWVTPPLPAGVEPMAWGLQGPSPFAFWAMGGSFQVRGRELFAFDGVRRFHATGLERSHRADDIGLRCVVEARGYLRQHASRWSSPDLRKDITALGRRWGSRAVPLLRELVAAKGAADSLHWLLEGAQS